MLQKLDKNHHKIWVTRPKLDAHNQVQILSDLGIGTIAYPLLNVTFFNQDLNITALKTPHTKYQAVVFTSANGVRAFVKNNGIRNIPVFAVGDVTTESARENGFTNITTAQGDVVSLADSIREKLSPHDGDIYHPASTIVARDLGTLLSDYGYTVDRQVVYNVDACEDLPPDMQTHMTHGTIGGVVLMSPRTANIFIRLMEKYQLDIADCHVFALSKAVADKLMDKCPCHIAHYPNFVQVLRHIKREYNIHDEYNHG